MPASMDNRRMNLTQKQILAVSGTGFIVIAACVVILIEAPSDQKLILTLCFSGLTTLVAIVYAIYGDYVKSWAHGIQLRIETPKENNSIIDLVQIEGGAARAYHHHLIVINERPHQAVKNCRVWLKKIYVLKPVLNNAPRWEEEQLFAVPRLMDWAPSEWKRDERTFCTTQIFDLGITLINFNRFFIKQNPNLGGNIKLEYGPGETLKVCLYMTADNYELESEFYFDVEITNLIQDGNLVPARVKPSSKP
jgi:hypothetical protein